MDWKKQTTDLLKTVNDAQRAMWNLCTDSIKTVASAPVDKKWVESVTAAEQVLTRSLKAQADLTAALLDRLGELEQAPATATESAQSIRAIVVNLNQTQQQMLSTWFDLLRTLDPAQRKGALADPVQRMQDLARQAMDTQLSLLRAWTGLTASAPTPTKTKTKSSTTKKSPARKKTTKKKSTSRKKSSSKSTSR